MNTQKSLAFLYNNNEKLVKQTKEIIPFTTVAKRIKYLGINIPEGTKDLYPENCKILFKAIYGFNATCIKLLRPFFTELKQKNFIICMETQKSPHSKSNTENERAEEIWIPYFSVYYKARVIKIVWYLNKNKNIDQWNRIQSPEINPHTYSHQIIDTGGENVQWRKHTLFNKWCYKN